MNYNKVYVLLCIPIHQTVANALEIRNLYHFCVPHKTNHVDQTQLICVGAQFVWLFRSFCSYTTHYQLHSAIDGAFWQFLSALVSSLGMHLRSEFLN